MMDFDVLVDKMLKEARNVRDFYRDNAGKDENSEEEDVLIAAGAEIVLENLRDMAEAFRAGIRVEVGAEGSGEPVMYGGRVSSRPETPMQARVELLGEFNKD